MTLFTQYHIQRQFSSNMQILQLLLFSSAIFGTGLLQFMHILYMKKVWFCFMLPYVNIARLYLNRKYFSVRCMLQCGSSVTREHEDIRWDELSTLASGRQLTHHRVCLHFTYHNVYITQSVTQSHSCYTAIVVRVYVYRK